MFVAAYDDRVILPDYFSPFISNTLRYCDLHFITPVKKQSTLPRFDSGTSAFQLHLINPAKLPQYKHVQQLFDGLFVNYSTSSEAFERACFDRWFALNSATTHLKNDDYVCLLDTDFVLGMAPSQLLAVCIANTKNRQLQFIAEWEGDTPVAISPEITIMTKGYLYGFCEYLLTSYYAPAMKSTLLQEYFERIGAGLSGGVCDMRALAAYSKRNTESCFNVQTLDQLQIISNFRLFLASDVGQTDDWTLSLDFDHHVLQVGEASKRLVGVHFQGDQKLLMHLAVDVDHKMTRGRHEEKWAEEMTFRRKLMRKIKRDLSRFANNLLKNMMKFRS